MSSILFFILLSLGIVRGDLQSQDYQFRTSQSSFTKSKTIRYYNKEKPAPDRIIKFTGQGSWDDK